MHKINLAEKLSLIQDHWNPRIAGELNGRMDYRETGSEQSEWIEPGEFVIVPRGIEHRPFAEEECEVLLFEPATTLNTGNVEDEFTRKQLETI